jgi:ectoine hydroxylase-related dioxygenase (phytanoyl-CoA dioxygenase family)
MAEIVHCAASTPAEQILARLDTDGAVIVDGVLSEGDLASLRTELDPYLHGVNHGRNDFAGFDTKRVGALVARSPKCRELVLDPMVNALAASVLNRHSDGYQLHFTQAVSIGPGESAQVLHRDRGVWGGYVPRRIETQISTIWAVNDFTRDNGATLVVPGSQHWDKDREAEPHEIAAAEMSAGAVLVYTGTVMHGGGTNVTEANRLGVLLHYTLNWLRQEENQYLSCPPDLAADLEPELRALMGYSQGGTVLGFYSAPVGPGEGPEIANPARLFDPTADWGNDVCVDDAFNDPRAAAATR